MHGKLYYRLLLSLDIHQLLQACITYCGSALAMLERLLHVLPYLQTPQLHLKVCDNKWSVSNMWALFGLVDIYR